MATLRQIRALRNKLQPEGEHTEIKVYWSLDDGRVAENIDGTGQSFTADEWEEHKKEAAAAGDEVLEVKEMRWQPE